MHSELDDDDGLEVRARQDGIGARIVAMAPRLGGKRQLAHVAGISESQLHRLIAGQNQPKLDSVVSIARAAGVSLEWLATGEGSMEPRSSLEGGDEAYGYVPLYDAKVSAGHGAWTEGARVLTKLAFTRYWLRKVGVSEGQCSAVRVAGDSMEPTLYDGDMVLVDHSRREIGADDVYVIRMDDILLAKRLRRGWDGGVEIISDNKAYSAMQVPAERLAELDIIGRVIYRGGQL